MLRILLHRKPDGSYKNYEYNVLYQVTKAIDAEGTFFEGTYNRDGLLVAEKTRPGVDKEYRYDKLGRIVEVKTGGEVTERYSYTTKGRTVTFTDGKGSDYVYSFDEFGRLVSEKNRIDGLQNYTYNDNAELAGKKDFEGNMTAVSYDTRTRTRKTSYADGTETVIVYDACGNILSAMNETGTVTYTYNKAGKLIRQTDTKTGETISYNYDKAGRKASLNSDKRRILYTYGKNGEIISVKDTVQNIAVSYGYDKCGRETERRFANGVVQKTRYDKAGRAVSIAQYNRTGQLISGEAYVYDETGRRSHNVNEKGLVTIYKYDNQSRLQTVFYPFNEDIKETARKEADKQGLYFLPSQGNPENYFLSTSEMVKLRAAAENLARARGNAITVNQVVWKESYTYDANGNRTSKTTSWGTIAYSYDKENRIVESGDLGKAESVKYAYDKNGNLLRESADRYRKDYMYNMQNRMVFSDVQDSVLNTRNITEYAYDAFGRRVETNQYLGYYTRNLYDGFSFDIIGKSVLQSAYSANLSDQKYRTPNRQSSNSVTNPETYASGRNNRGTDIGTRYRYIDENPLVTMPETTDNTSTSVNPTKTRSRPNNEYFLYSYGEPVAMTNDNSTSYFRTDILGSVRSVTDKYGTVQSDYSYDAFGSPYLGNLENDIGFGYCGKVYDVGTGLYDYGFRDYSPVSARFTTVDPIRDGSNWFSYVVNDPVNYVDLWGLAPRNMSEADRNAYMEEIAKYADYGTNNKIGLPDEYDCADVATYLYGQGMAKTNTGRTINDLTANGNKLQNIPDIHSSDFFPEVTDNITYYDDKSFNNPYVEVGTVAVWKAEDGDKSWVGHVATIVDVIRDEDGNVKSIVTIEGHTKKDTYVDRTNNSQKDWNSYKGDFLGFGEIGEDSTTSYDETLESTNKTNISNPKKNK